MNKEAELFGETLDSLKEIKSEGASNAFVDSLSTLEKNLNKEKRRLEEIISVICEREGNKCSTLISKGDSQLGELSKDLENLEQIMNKVSELKNLIKD